MQHQREKGLCYHCSEKYSPNHRCKSKSQFYLLDPDLDDKEFCSREEEQMVKQSRRRKNSMFWVRFHLMFCLVQHPLQHGVLKVGQQGKRHKSWLIVEANIFSCEFELPPPQTFKSCKLKTLQLQWEVVRNYLAKVAFKKQRFNQQTLKLLLIYMCYSSLDLILFWE